MLAILFGLAGSVASATAPVGAAEQNLSALVAAERGFAADAQVMGVHDAFVAHLSPDALLFRPQPVRAKDWFAAHKGGGGKLEWGPEYAEIAASGDFGFTWGPWRATAKTDKGEQQAWGHFVSVWQRGEDGVWRNIVDHGYGHAEVPLDATLSMRAPGHAAPTRVPAAETAQRQQRLFDLDDRLNGSDAAAALAALPPGTHYFREGQMPATQLAANVPATAAGLQRAASGMAASGDLAYTLGARADGKADGEGGYVRLWRYERDGWHMVANLLTPPN